MEPIETRMKVTLTYDVVLDPEFLAELHLRHLKESEARIERASIAALALAAVFWHHTGDYEGSVELVDTYISRA